MSEQEELETQFRDFFQSLLTEGKGPTTCLEREVFRICRKELKAAFMTVKPWWTAHELSEAKKNAKEQVAALLEPNASHQHLTPGESK